VACGAFTDAFRPRGVVFLIGVRPGFGPDVPSSLPA
jgi:hypothetical protein